jgi:predicted AAA+ superfamily ATPase
MERKLYKNILANLERKEYIIITGARQVGKTTILKQISKFLKEQDEPHYYLTFENPDILNSVNDHPGNILQFTGFGSQSGEAENGKKITLLIDEVQYHKNPSNFLKYHYDVNGDWLKIVATGSSAFYLDTKFKDSLAGRKKIFELFPLDFEEFLLFKGYPDWKNEWELMRNNHGYTSLPYREIFILFNEYLTFGGYPAVILDKDTEEKKEKLHDLVRTYLKRDVIDTGQSDYLKLIRLLKVLAGQAGQLLNIHELSNTLRFAGATIENYLYILQKCYHIHLVPPFYRSLRKELTKMPKLYFQDSGFRNSLLNQWQYPDQRLDKGPNIENYLFIRLRQLYGMESIRYWRTSGGNEIDFIVTPESDKEFAMESNYKGDDLKSSKYKIFTAAYPEIPVRIVAYETANPSVSLFRL